MLNLILKVFAALVAIGLLLVGFLAVALPRLVNTEEFRTALSEAAADALGSPVEWSELKAGVVPLRLIIEEPVLLSEAANREDARFTAQSIDLRLSAMALFRREIQVDSLVLRGVELVVTRTDEGFILPISISEEEDAAAEIEEGAKPDPDGTDRPVEVTSDDAFRLGFRRFLLTESHVLVRDQTLPRPIDWHLNDFELEATGDSLDQPLEIEFSSQLASGAKDVGAFKASGTVTLSGAYDLEMFLEQVLLAEIQPYVGEATLAGSLSGRATVQGASEGILLAEADLHVEGMAIETLGLDLVGRADLRAKQTSGEPVTFEADLDLAEAGEATVTGVMMEAGGIEAQVDMKGLELAPFAKLAGEEMDIGGRATGRLELTANAEGDITKLSTDLKVAAARYADAALQVSGALDLKLGMAGLGETDPFDFDVAMNLEGGGHVDAAGTATLAGAVDAKLNVASVDLKRIAAWVPEGSQVMGQLTGNADVRLTAERKVERLASKFNVADARIVSDGVDVSGVFDLDLGQLKDGPIQLDINLNLDDQSRMNITGTSTVEGIADVHLKIETFNLGIVKPFLPNPDMQLAGRASGSGRLVGDVTAPEFISFDVGIEGGSFKTSEVTVEGPFLAKIKVKEPLSRPRGRLELDLTAARLVYLDQFTKAAGMRAEMVTRFVPEESGETVFESELKLRNIDEILLQGAIGETVSVVMTTSRFGLAGWADVFPILGRYEADGIIDLDGVAVEWIEGSPREFGGRIGLHGVGLTIPDVGRVQLQGSILGEEKIVRIKGMKALVGGTTLGIQGTIEDPLGKGDFDFSVETLGESEVNDLLSELTSTKDTLFGVLNLGGELQGSLGGTAEVTQTLTGDLKFSIGEESGGMLRGVSILRGVLDQIPLLGGAARLSAPFRGGRSVDDYYAEKFEVIEGDFVIAGGKIEARKLRLSYPGYEARLTGPIRLKDFEIDMTGEVLLKEDLVSAIGGLAGANIDRKPIQIKLARVSNTLDDPKVKMTAETLAAVPKLLFQGTGLDTLAIGVGKTVKDAIGRVVGGGRK